MDTWTHKFPEQGRKTRMLTPKLSYSDILNFALRSEDLRPKSFIHQSFIPKIKNLIMHSIKCIRKKKAFVTPVELPQ